MESGKAYGFFYCKASKAEIEAELPTIRNLAQTPSELELFLTDDIKKINCDGKLLSIVKGAKKSGIAEYKYIMEATLPNATNEAASDELVMILIHVHQSPLYQEGEDFRGDVVYEKDGEYILRE